MVSQTDKLQAVIIKMFSVNDLGNSYNLGLNDKLNYFKGLLKEVHTELKKIENYEALKLWHMVIQQFCFLLKTILQVSISKLNVLLLNRNTSFVH